MKATIYVPENKSEIYERAKAELGDSISATFVRCLERELESKRIETGRIVVEIADKEDQMRKKAFEGRWLLGGPGLGEKHFFEEDSAIRGGAAGYSVALTKRGQLAVCGWDRDDLIRWFVVHPDFDDFSTNVSESGGYPPSLISAVAAQLNIDHVEEIDI
jgi:hypothetical protein